MNAHNHPVQTAADVLAMLEQARIQPLRKRDMMSAINRVCKMIGCPPADLRLDVLELRTRLAAIRPAAQGITPSTFANIRSLFAAAMEWAGAIDRLPKGAARMDLAWAPLAAGIAGDKRLANGLAAFMNWCARTGIQPASVDDGVLQRFLHWLQNRTPTPARATSCGRSRCCGRTREP